MFLDAVVLDSLACLRSPQDYRSTAQRHVASKVADVLHRVLLPVAPKFEGDGDGGEEKKSANSVNLKQSKMVGAIGFEPMTSTV